MLSTFSRCARAVFATFALGAASAAVANINGSVDTTWGGVEAGRVRIDFTLGTDNYDYLLDSRALDDGRLVALGVTRVSANDNRIAVAVRRANGTADTTIAPNGRYTITVTGIANSANAAGAIAPDGSFYVVGRAPNQQQLRVWHHAVDGTELSPPLDVGIAGIRYFPSAAHVDSAGRLLAAGSQEPATATSESVVDSYLLRLTAGGSAVDTTFGGIRTLVFDATQRDDIVDIVGVGENYAVCGRVGNLATADDLRFGVAMFTRSGGALTSFNGNGMYVDQLALNGNAASSACNSIDVVRIGNATRLVFTGRATATGQFARAYLVVVGLDGQLVAGTPRMVDFGFPTESTNAFPYLISAPGSDRIFLVGSGTYTSGNTRSMAVARMDPFGNYDTTWGDTPTGTIVSMTVPAIGGTQRNLIERNFSIGGGRLYLGANVMLDSASSDFALVRFTSDRIFASNLE
jgi:hypothetical protein